MIHTVIETERVLKPLQRSLNFIHEFLDKYVLVGELFRDSLDSFQTAFKYTGQKIFTIGHRLEDVQCAGCGVVWQDMPHYVVVLCKKKCFEAFYQSNLPFGLHVVLMVMALEQVIPTLYKLREWWEVDQARYSTTELIRLETTSPDILILGEFLEKNLEEVAVFLQYLQEIISRPPPHSRFSVLPDSGPIIPTKKTAPLVSKLQELLRCIEYLSQDVEGHAIPEVVAQVDLTHYVIDKVYELLVNWQADLGEIRLRWEMSGGSAGYLLESLKENQ